MTVLIQRTFDDDKVVSKTVTTIKTITGAVPFEQMSILHPRLIMEYDPYIIGGNYCYIPDFGKYYYMKITLDVGKRMILVCDVDPLKSWDVALRRCTGTILRSESKGKPTQIVDNKLPIDPNRHELLTLKILPSNGQPVFSSGGDNVLATVGNIIYSEVNNNAN